MKMLLKFSCLLLLPFLIGVHSRPTDQPTKFSLETPKEILDNSIITKQSGWERTMDLLGKIMDALRIGRGRLVNFVMMARNIVAERAEEFASEASNTVAAVLAARDARKIIEKVEAKRSTKKNDNSNVKKVENANVKKVENKNVKSEGKPVELKKREKRQTIETSSSTPIRIGPLDAFLPPKTRENVRLETEAGQSLFEIKKQKPAQTLLQGYFMPTPLVDRIKEEEKYGNDGDQFIGIGRALVNGFEGLSNFLNTVLDLPGRAAKKTSKTISAALNQVGGKLVGLE